MVSIYVLCTCRSYEVIIFECHLITKSELLIGCNQTSFLMKLSALSLVLVRVYWLDNKGSSLYLLVMVRVYWLDDKRTLLVCHWVR